MSTEPNPANSTRVMSIDALRGFDMFWIIGADVLATQILKTGNWSFSATLGDQLQHVEWTGFRFYDLIFPLFLFLVGCVLPYSLEKYRLAPSVAYWRVIRRTLLLILMGLLYNNLQKFDLVDMRWPGVLQRIGICYGVTSLIFLHSRPRGQAVVAAAILLGYWALLALVPVPGGIAGDFTKEGNLSGYIDRQLLPGKILELYYGYGDNEGLLSTVPAVATTLLGVLAGHWLRSATGQWTKVAGLAIAGVASLGIGYYWGQFFPIIKNIWTSSFVLWAGGWSLLLLALFYAVIDVLGWRRWSTFFVVIGMNAITIYFAQRFVDFRKISEFFLSGVASLSGDWGTAVSWTGVLAAKWLFLWFLYRQRVFLRV